MTNLQLSTVVGANVSTYENPSMDCMYDSMQDDLDDCGVYIEKQDGTKYKCIKVDGGYVEIRNVECNDGLDFEGFKKDFGEVLQEAIEHDVLLDKNETLTSILSRYGMQYKGMNFYTPKAYNYDSDSLDIRLKLIDENWSLDKYGLRELVQEYIDTKRKKSCDGYMSFEPSRIDEVERDDYSVLWAILKKEELIDTIHDAIQGFMEDGIRDIVYQNCNDTYYQIRIFDNGTLDTDRKYTLDYDKKELILIA